MHNIMAYEKEVIHSDSIRDQISMIDKITLPESAVSSFRMVSNRQGAEYFLADFADVEMQFSFA
jgi:hypothetical protein